jgi:hypothetical protein
MFNISTLLTCPDAAPTFRRLRSRITKLIIVLTLTLSLGLHWTFLQSVAWVGMVVTYSRDSSISQAIDKTFDGKHPCKLCQAVQDGKKSERKQDTQNPVSKIELFFAESTSFEVFANNFLPASGSEVRFSTRDDSPPVPPPRDLHS